MVFRLINSELLCYFNICKYITRDRNICFYTAKAMHLILNSVLETLLKCRAVFNSFVAHFYISQICKENICVWISDMPIYSTKMFSLQIWDI
jgi:hypothetical protein